MPRHSQGSDGDPESEDYWAPGYEPTRGEPDREDFVEQDGARIPPSFSPSHPSVSGAGRVRVEQQMRELESTRISNQHLGLPKAESDIPFSMRSIIDRANNEVSISVDSIPDSTITMRLVNPEHNTSVRLYESGPSKIFSIPKTKLVYDLNPSRYADPRSDKQFLANLTILNAVDSLYGKNLNKQAKLNLSEKFQELALRWKEENIPARSYRSGRRTQPPRDDCPICLAERGYFRPQPHHSSGPCATCTHPVQPAQSGPFHFFQTNRWSDQVPPRSTSRRPGRSPEIRSFHGFLDVDDEEDDDD
ncbi:uncharacterized protein I206_106075 [Kwoniella pini CBS 10737]|uniref:Uncharacterized protein n=1 Tax=Kwoniella pini CBS 10737 TaxID=1296096 RepID=A0A1B9I0Z2_9TREE|nr:uncharacterized protein I206_04898 [Kwoniella pini CBS 10737]OCF49210.1 hypothetical protein I206_04898 [Kwoniella pini CBS 10737]